MALHIIYLIAGLILILVGASCLVDGSSNIARRFGISEFIIGLTIVGIGTSSPEMVVSFLSAFNGSSELAIGNIIGSNIFNTCLIIGITALIAPLAITKGNLKRDIPMNMFATVLMLLLSKTIGQDGISRIDGVLLLTIYLLYIVFSLYKDKKVGASAQEETAIADEPKQKTSLSIAFLVGGFVGLIFGGRIFVNSATEIAEHFGISQKFIAVTILAGGTSLPELATSVVAAIKGKGQMALGNVLGSNICNILLILGGTAVICPISSSSISLLDMIILIGGALLFAASAFSFKKDKIDRVEAVIFTLAYAIYMGIMIYNL